MTARDLLWLFGAYHLLSCLGRIEWAVLHSSLGQVRRHYCKLIHNPHHDLLTPNPRFFALSQYG